MASNQVCLTPEPVFFLLNLAASLMGFKKYFQNAVLYHKQNSTVFPIINVMFYQTPTIVFYIGPGNPPYIEVMLYVRISLYII